MDSVENLEKTCQRIIRLDPKIRSARIINSRGHLVAGAWEGACPRWRHKSRTR